MEISRIDPAVKAAEDLLRRNLVEIAEEKWFPALSKTLAESLGDHGVARVGDLFWPEEDWFANPSRHWITDNLRKEILDVVAIIRERLEHYIDIQECLLRIKQVNDFMPATNDPKGEPHFPPGDTVPGISSVYNHDQGNTARGCMR